MRVHFSIGQNYRCVGVAVRLALLACAVCLVNGIQPIIWAAPTHAQEHRLDAISADTSPQRAHTDTEVHIPNCVQAPPQSVKDRAAYTTTDLARYGLPPQTPGEPIDKWRQMVRVAGQRLCSYTQSADQFTSLLQNTTWTGSMADGPTVINDPSHPADRYTEADIDYYVPCVSVTDEMTSDMSTWIGLGGAYTNVGTLVQAGTLGYVYYNLSAHRYVATYRVFVESPQDGSDKSAHYFDGFSLHCGNHMYVKVWDTATGACMFVMRIDDGVNTGNQCYGPRSDELTAEGIVEYSSNLDTTNVPYFANFGHVTLYGVGITDNGTYKAMNQLIHDYPIAYHTCTSDPPPNHTIVELAQSACYGAPYASVGPIQNDPGDSPYDEYTITWQSY